MKYYLSFYNSMTKHSISKEKFYSLRRSKKWREKIWVQNDKIVARVLIERQP